MTNQTTQEAKPNRMFKAREVAELLNVSAHSVYEMCNDGRLPYMRIGKTGNRNIRIAQSDLENFLTESRTIGSR